EFAPLEQITEENFHKQFNLNVLGLLLASQAAAKLFAGEGGSIINLSSIVSTLAVSQGGRFSAPKRPGGAITPPLAARPRGPENPRKRDPARDGGNGRSPFRRDY